MFMWTLASLLFPSCHLDAKGRISKIYIRLWLEFIHGYFVISSCLRLLLIELVINFKFYLLYCRVWLPYYLCA